MSFCGPMRPNHERLLRVLFWHSVMHWLGKVQRWDVHDTGQGQQAGWILPCCNSSQIRQRQEDERGLGERSRCLLAHLRPPTSRPDPLARGAPDGGGYVASPDRKEQVKHAFSSREGTYTFTIDRPLPPDDADAPTRLVVAGNAWNLFRGDFQVASGRLD